MKTIYTSLQIFWQNFIFEIFFEGIVSEYVSVHHVHAEPTEARRGCHLR